MPVGEKLVDAIVDVVRRARPDCEGSIEAARDLAWGPGPRASQALMLAVRARALLDGRFAPSLDDVALLLPPVLRHRMALTFTARAEGRNIDYVLARLVATLP
jgi:MoxR-like ATPase